MSLLENVSDRVRRTKIVATLGPGSVPKIKQLIQAGVNMFRLNFSHVEDPNSQLPVIASIRSASKDLGVHVAILGDLGGPKIRCNALPAGLTSIPLVKDATITLKASDDPLAPGVITTSVKTLIQQLELEHRVLFDDGTMSVKITKRISATELQAIVLVGGQLKSHKGMNVPDLKLNIPALTEKDRVDATFLFEQELDFVALSFVQVPEDITMLRDHFASLYKAKVSLAECDSDICDVDSSWRPLIVSKIEKPQALDRIDEIIAISDVIMVARGDLGVECSLERVPIIQKTLIRKCNAAETPVITATQMLESMINSPVPTRAEVSDVANAVIDGTDAVMLSGESAVGAYPIEAVATMGLICLNAESVQTKSKVSAWDSSRKPHLIELAHPVADAAVQAAEEGNAGAIVVFTFSGDMAQFVSTRRPERPIVAVCPDDRLARRLAICYGVYPIVSGATKTATSLNTDKIYEIVDADLKSSQLAEKLNLTLGRFVVYCAGKHPGYPGLSYTIKIAKFGNHSI